MPLAQYLKSFSRLRTDKNRKRWSALTAHQAPHKPFLLLSIMDLIAQGSITQPSIFLRYLLQITAPPKPLIREYCTEMTHYSPSNRDTPSAKV